MYPPGWLRGKRSVRRGAQQQAPRQQNCCDSSRGKEPSSCRCQEQELPRLLLNLLPSIYWVENSNTYTSNPQVRCSITLHSPPSTTLQVPTGKHMATKSRRTGMHAGPLQGQVGSTGKRGSRIAATMEAKRAAHAWGRSLNRQRAASLLSYAVQTGYI